MSELVKQAIGFIANSTASSTLLSLAERNVRWHDDYLVVLVYHRVDQPCAHPMLDPDLISATPEAFDQQMRYLATNYHVVSMAEVLDAFQSGIALPARSVLITFDDAYSDFATYAWPILKTYRLPVTLF